MNPCKQNLSPHGLLITQPVESGQKSKQTGSIYLTSNKINGTAHGIEKVEVFAKNVSTYLNLTQKLDSKVFKCTIMSGSITQTSRN